MLAFPVLGSCKGFSCSHLSFCSACFSLGGCSRFLSLCLILMQSRAVCLPRVSSAVWRSGFLRLQAPPSPRTPCGCPTYGNMCPCPRRAQLRVCAARFLLGPGLRPACLGGASWAGTTLGQCWCLAWLRSAPFVPGSRDLGLRHDVAHTLLQGTGLHRHSEVLGGDV